LAAAWWRTKRFASSTGCSIPWLIVLSILVT
jgi:hypothetical protein